MIVSPPHLPPQSCRIDTHHRLQNLRWIVFIFAAAFLSGVSAALVTVAWIVPVTEQPVSYFFGIRSKEVAVQQTELDIDTVRAIEQRTLSLVQTGSIVNNYVVSGAHSLKSAIISSDGWAVVYYPEKFDVKKWQAVEYQGVVYSIEKAVRDGVGDLVYIKVVGQGFRINAFVNWDGLQSEEIVWGSGKRMESFGVLLSEFSGEENINVWQPQFLRKLDGAAAPGILLFNGNGDLFGITGESKRVIPSWLIEKQVGSFMNSGSAVYDILPWSGYWINGASQDGKIVSLSGFYITDIGDKAYKNIVKNNDVLIKINGQPISQDLLSKQIIFAQPKLTVTVLRAGKEVEMDVSKVKLTN